MSKPQQNICVYNMEKICEQLNKLIDEKKEGFIDEVNAIIAKVYEDGGSLYWDRQIYIDYGFDDEAIKDLVRKSNKVHFYPTDDPIEHKGVCVKYKMEKHKYQVLQMKEPTFANYKYLIEKLGGLNIDDYDVVYEGEIDGNDTYGILDEIFELFNVNQPADFIGHSLSVSDIVVLDGTMWYCNSIGWVNVGKHN